MIWLAICLAIIGLALSAFFSGSETGFYRVPVIRLQLDTLSGDRLARRMLWLRNHPAIFVATTLIGNNLANYCTSLAMVIMAQQLWPGDAALVGELLAPMILTPFLFVYGELLPKYLFLYAPYRLLRRGIPLFLVFIPLFAPISIVLFALNRLIARVLGQPHDLVQPRLAQRELRKVLDEGHHAGILRPSQWKLARGIFAATNETVESYVIPIAKFPRAYSDMTKAAVLRTAERQATPELPIMDAKTPGKCAGCVRVIDLQLSNTPNYELQPLTVVSFDDTVIDCLLRMQAAEREIALAVDADERPLGIVTAARLRNLLFDGEQTTSPRVS